MLCAYGHGCVYACLCMSLYVCIHMCVFVCVVFMYVRICVYVLHSYCEHCLVFMYIRTYVIFALLNKVKMLTMSLDNIISQYLLELSMPLLTFQ